MATPEKPDDKASKPSELRTMLAVARMFRKLVETMATDAVKQQEQPPESPAMSPSTQQQHQQPELPSPQHAAQAQPFEPPLPVATPRQATQPETNKQFGEQFGGQYSHPWDFGAAHLNEYFDKKPLEEAIKFVERRQEHGIFTPIRPGAEIPPELVPPDDWMERAVNQDGTPAFPDIANRKSPWEGPVTATPFVERVDPAQPTDTPVDVSGIDYMPPVRIPEQSPPTIPEIPEFVTTFIPPAPAREIDREPATSLERQDPPIAPSPPVLPPSPKDPPYAQDTPQPPETWPGDEPNRHLPGLDTASQQAGDAIDGLMAGLERALRRITDAIQRTSYRVEEIERGLERSQNE